jgi:hypothetical protein
MTTFVSVPLSCIASYGIRDWAVNPAIALPLLVPELGV